MCEPQLTVYSLLAGHIYEYFRAVKLSDLGVDRTYPHTIPLITVPELEIVHTHSFRKPETG
jgi:hypothetical protein